MNDSSSQIFENKGLIQLLVLLLIIIQVAFFASIYITSALLGQLDYPKIFISHAISLDPGRAIAAYLLPLSAILILVIIGSRFYRMYPLLPSRSTGAVVSPRSGLGRLRSPRIIRGLYWFLLFCLFVMVITMIGVSAVAISTQRWVHWIIAGLMFLFGTMLVVFFPVLDRELHVLISRWIFRFRWFLAIFAFLMGISLGVFAPTIKLVGAIIEIVGVVVLIVFVITFAHPSEFPLRTSQAARIENGHRHEETPRPRELVDSPRNRRRLGSGLP